MTYIVGIDPGEKGAVAIIPAYSFRETIAMPMEHNTMSDVYLHLSEMRGERSESSCSVYQRAKPTTPIKKDLTYIKSRLPAIPKKDNSDTSMEVYLEQPGQIMVNRLRDGKDNTAGLLAGMSASRKLGRSVGQWEGICTALHILPTLVAPKKWQSKLGCPTRGDKNISKNLAIRVFPFLTDGTGKSTITHGTADALLIALYGYLQTANPNYIPRSVKDNINL